MNLNENREEELLGAEGEEEILDDPAEEVEEEAVEEEEETEGEDEEEKEDDEPDGEEFVMPDKFKGKTPEEIAKAYRNLESTIDSRVLKKAQQLLTSGQSAGLKKPDGTNPTKDELDAFEEELKNVDFTKFTPAEFARWMHKRVMVEATRIAQETFTRATEQKRAISSEIATATKSHPHLKDNREYREIVVAIIEAGSAKGQHISLKKACEKADKAMNITPAAAPKGDETPPPAKPKPKTAVEKPDGSGGGVEKSEEDKVKEGILGAGKPFTLGGLGL